MSKAKKKAWVKTSKSAAKKSRKKKRKRRTWHDEEFDAITLEARKIREKYGRNRKSDPPECEASCSSSLLNEESVGGSVRPPTNIHRTHKVDFETDIVPGSWVCSLCGRGMAYEDLGDLFGPYYISSPRRVPDFLLPPKEPKFHIYQKGVYKQPIFELWFHGSCALWAHGLFLDGTELVDLEETVYKFWGQKCEVCAHPGASIPCDNVFLHYQCAKNNSKYYTLNPSLFTCDRSIAASPGSPQL